MADYHDIRIEYPEKLETTSTGILDLSGSPLRVDIADIDQYPNQAYALMRRNGLGGSDSSIILGVNPFKDRQALIEEKCRTYLTEEELAIGDKVAVRKGRDLEPLIMDKYEKILKKRIFKPVDMYQFVDYPWLKMNYDGVVDKAYTDTGFQYIPAEIKVVTYQGQKHYNKNKAWFYEGIGFQQLPPDYSAGNNSIETKAAQYGIPPYYYTQLQQEIMGVGAPFGYLAVMFDWSWEVAVYFVWADAKVQTALIIESNKVWTQVLQNREANFDTVLQRNIQNAIDQAATLNAATSAGPDISLRSDPVSDENTGYGSPDNIIGRL